MYLMLKNIKITQNYLGNFCFCLLIFLQRQDMQIGIVFQSNFQEFPSPTSNLITWIMQPYLPDT